MSQACGRPPRGQSALLAEALRAPQSRRPRLGLREGRGSGADCAGGGVGGREKGTSGRGNSTCIWNENAGAFLELQENNQSWERGEEGEMWGELRLGGFQGPPLYMPV